MSKYIDDASTWFDYIEVKFEGLAVEDVLIILLTLKAIFVHVINPFIDYIRI